MAVYTQVRSSSWKWSTCNHVQAQNYHFLFHLHYSWQFISCQFRTSANYIFFAQTNFGYPNGQSRKMSIQHYKTKRMEKCTNAEFLHWFFFNSSCFTQQHTSNVSLPWKPWHLGGCLATQELLLEGTHEAALLLMGLEATMTPLAGGVDELQGDLLHVATTEGCQQWLQREVEQWQCCKDVPLAWELWPVRENSWVSELPNPWLRDHFIFILVTHSFASRSTEMNKTRLSWSITPRQDGQTKLSQSIRFTETTAY